jgi:hypothetical protein
VTILGDRLTFQNFPYIRCGLGRATSTISRPIQEAYLQQPSERAFCMILSVYRKSNPIGFSFYSSLRLSENFRGVRRGNYFRKPFRYPEKTSPHDCHKLCPLTTAINPMGFQVVTERLEPVLFPGNFLAFRTKYAC